MTSKPRLLALTALALAIVMPPAIAQDSVNAPQQANLTKTDKKDVLDAMSHLILKSAYVPGVDFTKWTTLIEKERPTIDKVSTEGEFSNAVNEALQGFGFSHIYLLPPQVAEARVNASTIGIGVQITKEDDGLLVRFAFPSAPAAKAGIVPGDVLVEADGKKIEDPTQLRGHEGEKVRVKAKKSDGTFKEYSIVRARYSTVHPEELKWVDKDTAALSIYTFDLNYDAANVEGLMTQASKAKNLILDLRGNGGGAVINLTHLLGLLMPSDTPIGTFITKRLVERYVEEAGGKPEDLKRMADWATSKLYPTRNKIPYFKGHIAVLVNGGSGSASEIAAEALKEHLNSPIVGTRSAGAVLVSVIVPIAHGFQLQYPITDYISAKGVRLEKTGVTPDSVTDTQQEFIPGKPDPAWKFAQQLLNKIS